MVTRNKEFGEHVLSINDPKEFLTRLLTALERLGKPARAKLITYISESEFHGAIPDDEIGFYKLDSFKHQNEYRLLIYGHEQSKQAITLQIGDLSDITNVYHFDELDIRMIKN